MAVNSNLATLTPHSLGFPLNSSEWNSRITQLNSIFQTGTSDISPRQLVTTMTTGENITVGDFVRVSGSTILKVDNTSAVGVTNFLGCALETKTSGNACKVSTNRVEGLSGLPVGQTFYIGTSGTVTSTKPTGAAFIKAIGYSISTTAILFDSFSTSDVNFSGNVGVRGSSLEVGVNDLVNGTIHLYGNGTGTQLGGNQKFYLSADYDTTFQSYLIASFEDDLLIQRDGIDNIIEIKGDTGNIGLSANQLFIDNVNGRVGISVGTIPSAALDIGKTVSIKSTNDGGSTESGILYFSGSDNSRRFTITSTITSNTINDYMTFRSNDNDNILNLYASGQVSIGKNFTGSELNIGFDGNSIGAFLRLENRATVSSGTGQEIAFCGYRDADPNYRVARIVINHGASAGFGDTVHTGDMAFWTNDGQGIFQNGLERMRLTHDGFLGIGSTVPSAYLDVLNTVSIKGKNDGAGESAILYFSGSDNSRRFTIEGGINKSPDDYLKIRSLATDNILVARAGGNVGIGTGTPGSSLHVAGTMPSVPVGAGVHMGLSGNDSGIQLNAVNSTANSYIDFGYTGGLDSQFRMIYTINTNSFKIMSFTEDNILTIRQDGNIGIGDVDNPGSSLHVSGFIPNQPLGLGIHMGRSGVDSAIKINSTNSSSVSILDFRINGGSNYDGRLSYAHSDDSFNFYSNGGTQTMLLSSTGNMRIPGGIATGNENTFIKRKIVTIPVWNMQNDDFLDLDIGVTVANYRGSRAIILVDGSTSSSDLQTAPDVNDKQVQGMITHLGSGTNIRLRRTGGERYDNASYNSTTQSRGWVIVDYV